MDAKSERKMTAAIMYFFFLIRIKNGNKSAISMNNRGNHPRSTPPTKRSDCTKNDGDFTRPKPLKYCGNNSHNI
jgi:hypothetical protein